MDNFIARPTDVLTSFLATRPANNRARDEYMLRLGRIAMGMEVLTVIHILEEHQLLAEHEAMVACLQTLLVDQDLFEDTTHWYEHLAEWRRIKLVPGENVSEPDASIVVPDVQPSEHAVPPDASLPHGSNGAQLGSDQSQDPPSGE